MKGIWFAACGAILAMSLGYGAQSEVSGKTIVITPSKLAAGSADQQLVLRGLKAPADAAGVQVFLNPEENGTLSPESHSYVGSIFFSHRREGEDKGQNFVLTLRKPVTGKARVVLYPVSASGRRLAAKLDLQDAGIQPVDNSSFR